MDHEFPQVNTSLKIKGYKIDGSNGVKKECQLSDLKSVDYFFIPEKDKLVFVEFSDLYKYYDQEVVYKKEQFKNLISLAKLQDPSIKDDLESIKRFFIKVIDQRIFAEFSTKFKDSFFLKELLVHYSLMQNLPAEIKIGPIDTYIIVVPPTNHLEEHQQQEVLKFLGRLQDSLSCALSKYHVVNRVRLVPLSQLI